MKLGRHDRRFWGLMFTLAVTDPVPRRSAFVIQCVRVNVIISIILYDAFHNGYLMERFCIARCVYSRRWRRVLSSCYEANKNVLYASLLSFQFHRICGSWWALTESFFSALLSDIMKEPRVCNIVRQSGSPKHSAAEEALHIVDGVCQGFFFFQFLLGSVANLVARSPPAVRCNHRESLTCCGSEKIISFVLITHQTTAVTCMQFC